MKFYWQAKGNLSEDLIFKLRSEVWKKSLDRCIPEERIVCVRAWERQNLAELEKKKVFDDELSKMKAIM